MSIMKLLWCSLFSTIGIGAAYAAWKLPLVCGPGLVFLASACAIVVYRNVVGRGSV